MVEFVQFCQNEKELFQIRQIWMDFFLEFVCT